MADDGDSGNVFGRSVGRFSGITLSNVMGFFLSGVPFLSDALGCVTIICVLVVSVTAHTNATPLHANKDDIATQLQRNIKNGQRLD